MAAHGHGGGALMSGAAVIQLLVVAATVGAMAWAHPRGGHLSVMLLLLGAGQLAGHAVLSLGHDHGSGQAPAAWLMVSAHLVAIAFGAALISAGDRLCRAVSRVLRLAVRSAAGPVAAAPNEVVPSADHPMRAALLLASSMSHRGPPAGACR